MKEDYLNGITRDSPFDDDMFVEIIETKDPIDRTRFIEDVRRKCKEVGRTNEFNNMLRAWVEKNAQLIKQGNSNSTQFTDAPMVLKCGNYIADDSGISITEVTKTGDMLKYVACPHPIMPIERLVNIDTETEKLKLAFFKDCRWKTVTVDCGTAYNKSYICQLADRGVMVTSESAKDLVKYLSTAVSLNMQDIPLYKSISRLGWIGDEFAPYVSDVKYDGDADFKSIYDHVCEAGTYSVWLDHITELRKDINIRLMLATSFASALIERVGGLPFVLHLWGTTGFGKTVSLMVAASIWGNPDLGCMVRSMNMTANAMARTASFLYNVPFCADELQQIKDNWNNYDKLIMYLTEGIDRARAKQRGGVEDVKVWRNSFILTGEEPVTKANSGGGVKNRVIEIEVKDKIIEDGNKTANLVKENYGFAGKRFVEYVKALPEESVKAEYKKIFTDIVETCDTTEKQAMSMSLILLADKYACACVFADSSPLNLSDVKEYLISAKTVDMPERAYEWVTGWIAENSIRFNDDPEENRGAMWGKIDDNVATINKNVLVEGMKAAGFDLSACMRKWVLADRVLKNSQGYTTHQTSVNTVRAPYIKLVLPCEEPFTETDEQVPFGQESIPFD